MGFVAKLVLKNEMNRIGRNEGVTQLVPSYHKILMEFYSMFDENYFKVWVLDVNLLRNIEILLPPTPPGTNLYYSWEIHNNNVSGKLMIPIYY